ncbi:MAG: HAMP domain-containing histidine kinase [Oscillospiraceae bacterium]|nr:HAMP domain-containing histidine kinase [Oscillospiraceae bacterium]
MSKAIRSPMTKLALLIAGYITALSVACEFHTMFYDHIERALGNWFKMPAAAALPLFAACSGVLGVSVWKSERRPRVWHKIDFSLLSVLVLCTVIYGTYYTLRDHIETQVLLLSIGVYVIVMTYFMETAARLRDRTMKDSLYWVRFFKQYPIWSPIGLLMALLLSGNLLCLYMWLPLNAIRGLYQETTPHLSGEVIGVYRDRLDISVALLLLFVLIGLTYFCAFVLSLSARYEKANAEKIRAERFKAELITNVSHDIRTPLTSIINYVDLLKALPVEHESFTEYVNVLDKKSTRLKMLINDLMEASKAATGNMAVNLREIELSEIVGQIAGEFEEPFTERGLTLVLRQPEQSVFIQADSGHLWRVFENLFGNAAKYALTGTRVFAEIVLRDSGAVFSIKNTSLNPIEISGDALTEQFMRGDRARQTEGSGLGLYIAKSLVELMGASFAVSTSGDLFEVGIMF